MDFRHKIGLQKPNMSCEYEMLSLYNNSTAVAQKIYSFLFLFLFQNVKDSLIGKGYGQLIKLFFALNIIFNCVVIPNFLRGIITFYYISKSIKYNECTYTILISFL